MHVVWLRLIPGAPRSRGGAIFSLTVQQRLKRTASVAA
jgi:hypothetical protein